MGTQLRGWRTFAGILFYLVGAFNVIGGLAAIFKDEFFLASANQLLLFVDYTAWEGSCSSSALHSSSPAPESSRTASGHASSASPSR